MEGTLSRTSATTISPFVKGHERREMLRGNPTYFLFRYFFNKDKQGICFAWLNKDFRWLAKENAGLSFIISSIPLTPAIIQEQFGWVVSWPAMNMAPKSCMSCISVA